MPIFTQKTITGAICVCLILFSVNIDAAFLGRLAATTGGTDYQAYYDEDADLTWLADANLAKTSGHDPDGRMIWENAVAWAESLDVAGVTGWHLPTTMQPDTSCSSQSDQGDSFPIQGFGTGCLGSEMGHLYNVDGITPAAPGPFSNVQSDLDGYWSATEYAPRTNLAAYFDMGFGSQHVNGKHESKYGWAVHLGDVSPIPVPAAVWLFGSGLIGLIAVARHKSVNS